MLSIDKVLSVGTGAPGPATRNEKAQVRTVEVVLGTRVLSSCVVLERMQDLDRSGINQVSSDSHGNASAEFVVLHDGSGVSVDPVDVVLEDVD